MQPALTGNLLLPGANCGTRAIMASSTTRGQLFTREFLAHQEFMFLVVRAFICMD